MWSASPANHYAAGPAQPALRLVCYDFLETVIVDRERVMRIIEVMKTSGVAELTVREGDAVVRVRRASNGQVSAGPPIVEELQGSEGIAESVAADQAGSVYETLPVSTHLVGFFHQTDESGQPLVSVGEKVKAGQKIGAIEALRMMTDLISPAAGEVVSIEVADGHAVQYGDVLLRIRPA